MPRIFQWLLASLIALTGIFAQSDYTFSDGGRRGPYRMSQDEVFSKAGSAGRSTAGSQDWGSGQILKLKASESSRKMAKATPSRSRASLAPVFYYLPDLPAADRLAALPAGERDRMLSVARRVMTPKLLVHIDNAHTSALAETHPTGFEESVMKGWMLISYADAYAALDAADWMIRKGGFEFTPVFSRVMSTRQQATLNRQVSDPLYPNQWHLQPTSQFHLNMGNAWDQVTGKNINITVVDDGMEVRHEDLATTSFPLGQGFHMNFNDGDATDPTPTAAKQNHGTSCAGLIAATGFNNIGVTGVAPEASLMGLRLIAGDSADDASARAMAWQPDGIFTHVSSNSWGPADDGKSDGRISPLQLAAMQKAVAENRGGLGTVFLISAGNGRDRGDDESYDGFSASRFGIAVAAVNRGGNQSSYSESGMAVAISAFGGEFEQPDVMWTTNVSGPEAFALKAASFPTSQAPVNYTDSFNGTSAAAPQVSGAVALMLEKNPKLGYRDVKEILMTTAFRDGLKGKDDFFKNAAGFTLSHSFGAGLVNVAAALDLASKWTNLGPEISSEAEVAPELAIADDGSEASVNVDLGDPKIRVEHVELTFTVVHPKRGDLSFRLISPSGTVSRAAARPPDEGADFSDYTMTSVMNWGESAAGVWKVGFVDNAANGATGTVKKVKVKVYGTALAK